MGKTALLACVAVLLQVHLEFSQALPLVNNVNVKQTTTYQFKIDHALDMAYTSDAQRDSLLQQILSVWKTILAPYSVSNLKIKFLQQGNSVSAGHQMVQYRVSGDSSSQVNLQDAVSSFESQLPSSGITGVATMAMLGLSSGGSNGGVVHGPSQLTQFTVDLTLIVTGGSVNDMSKQILSLWQSTFGSKGFTNQKITTTDQQQSGNGQSVTYRITGSSKSSVDITSLVATFATALQSANIAGLDLTPLLSQVDVGDSSSNAGSLVNGVVNGGPSSGGSSFTVNNQQVQISASSDSDLQDLLNQILALWKTTLSQSRVSNVQINVVSKTKLPNNQGYKVVYSITGQSQAPVNVQQVSTQFISSFNSNNIGGVTLVPSGGSSVTKNKPKTGLIQPTPFTIGNQQLQLTYNSDADLSKLLQQILSVWKTVFGYDTSSQATNLKIKTISKTPVGNNVYNVVYQITGQAGKPINTQDMSTQFMSQLSMSSITGVNLVGTVNNVVNGATNGLIGGGSLTGGGGSMNQGQNMGGGGSWSQTQTINGGGSSNVDRSGDKAGKNFQFTQDILLQFTTNAQRDQFLQGQILGMWKYATGVYDASKIKLVFLTSKPAPDTGSNFQTVTYRVTGKSDQALDQQTVLNSYFQAVTNGGFDAIKLPEGVGSASAGAAAFNGVSNNGGSGGGGASFQVDSSSVLTYTSSSQRDSLLQQLLSLFKTTFSSLGLSSTSIVFIRDAAAAGQGSAKQVFYRITGQSASHGPLDVPSTIDQFNQAISTSNIKNIAADIGGSVSNIGGTMTGNQDDNGAGNGGGGGASFQVDSSSLLTYTSSSQRDSLLQQLLNLFKTTFSSLGLTSTSIVFIRDAPATGQGSAKQVFYRITGQSSQGPVDVPSTMDQFNQAISTSNIKNIAVNIIGSASNTGGNTIGGITNTFGGITGNQNGNGGGNAPFQVDDSVIATYTSNSQRDAYLQQLLSLFKTTFSQSGVTNVKIVFSRDAPSTNGGKQLFYRITGSSSQTMDSSDWITQFESAISNANLNGITLPSGGSGSSGSFPISITRKDLVLTYTSSQQRDDLLQQILSLWQTVFSQYQASNLQIKFVSESAQNAAGGRTVTYTITGSAGMQFDLNALIQSFLSALQGAPIAGVSLVGAAVQKVSSSIGAVLGGSGGAFSIPGKIKLTYKDDSQRDTFLNQVLVMWRTSVWDYQVSNVQIKMTGVTGAAPTRMVSYVITGTSALPIDLQAATDTFQTTLNGSHLTGVQIA